MLSAEHGRGRLWFPKTAVFKRNRAVTKDAAVSVILVTKCDSEKDLDGADGGGGWHWTGGKRQEGSTRRTGMGGNHTKVQRRPLLHSRR